MPSMRSTGRRCRLDPTIQSVNLVLFQSFPERRKLYARTCCIGRCTTWKEGARQRDANVHNKEDKWSSWCSL